MQRLPATTRKLTMTEPFTSAFGAVPRPEEPVRWPDPPAPGLYGGFGDMTWEPERTYYPPSQYAVFSPSAPQANATVVNNIRMTAGGYGYRRCNHLLHGTLTVLTCGLWAPVWAVAWLASRQR